MEPAMLCNLVHVLNKQTYRAVSSFFFNVICPIGYVPCESSVFVPLLEFYGKNGWLLAIKTASVTSLLLIWILINNLSDKKPHVHVALK